MLDLEVIEAPEDLPGLRREWEELLDRCAYRTPFYSLDWLRIWWDVFGPACGLRVLVLREGGSLLGIAPLMFSTERRARLLRIRKLGLVWNYYTPRVDFLLAAQPDACLRRILEYCEGEGGRWDMVEFTYLPEDSGNAARLKALLLALGSPALVRTCLESPHVRFEGGFEKYLQTRSAHFRRNLSNARNRLRKEGESEFVVLREGSKALDEPLEELFALSLRSWKGTAGTAEGARAELRRFYGRVAECWACKGGLELRFLRVNGAAVASLISLIESGRVYTLKTAYDPRYRRLSPGTLIFHSLLEDHLNRGAREIDFVAVKQAYLDRWCTGYRRHFNVCIFKKGNPYSRLLYHLKRDFKPFYRDARARAASLAKAVRKERANGTAETGRREG
jgi:CelD/BcsL family acetyltransferase involved in cellulose biosynthesis